MTVNLFANSLPLPQLPPHFNDWNENEDMVAFHLKAIHQQVCATRQGPHVDT